MADEECEECEECEEGAPAWTTTFSDLATILLTFFILMLSFAEIDITRFKKALGSIQHELGFLPTGTGFFQHTMKPTDFVIRPFPVSAFKGVSDKGDGVDGMGKKLKGQEQLKSEMFQLLKKYLMMSDNSPQAIDNADDSKDSASLSAVADKKEQSQDKSKSDSANKMLMDNVAAISSKKLENQMKKEISLMINQFMQSRHFIDSAPLSDDRKKAIKQDLEKVAKELGLDKDVSVEISKRGVVMTIADSIFFDSGKAKFKESSFPVLKKIGQIIKNYHSQVSIEGHTDNVPIKPGGRFTSNWDLSTARSYTTLLYFKNIEKIDVNKIHIAGYADNHPVASNSTDEGRAKNRRVEFIFYE